MQGENMKFQLTCFTLLLHTAILIYIYIIPSILISFLEGGRKIHFWNQNCFYAHLSVCNSPHFNI